MPKQTFFNLSESRQKMILDAALTEFGSRPFEYANISEIIRETGISRGSFYQYFDDKSDLFDYLLQMIGQAKADFYGSLFDFQKDMPFLDRLEALYIEGVRFSKTYPQYVNLSRQLIASADPRVVEQQKQSIDGARNLFLTLIRHDIGKKRLRDDLDPNLFATLVTDVMTHIMLGKYLEINLDQDAFKAEIKQLIDLFRKGTNPYV